MVGSIYFIEMPYSDFKQFKGRPVLVFKMIDKEDVLILPLTTNLNRKGIIIDNKDIASGSLKKESVVIVPKITAIDASLLTSNHLLATLKAESFTKVTQALCTELECNS